MIGHPLHHSTFIKDSSNKSKSNSTIHQQQCKSALTQALFKEQDQKPVSNLLKSQNSFSSLSNFGSSFNLYDDSPDSTAFITQNNHATYNSDNDEILDDSSTMNNYYYYGFETKSTFNVEHDMDDDNENCLISNSTGYSSEMPCNANMNEISYNSTYDLISTSSMNDTACMSVTEDFRLGEQDLKKIRMCKNVNQYKKCVLFSVERFNCNETGKCCNEDFTQDNDYETFTESCKVTLMLPCLIKSLEQCGLLFNHSGLNNESDCNNTENHIKVCINELIPYMTQMKMMIQRCKGCFNLEQRVKGVILNVLYRFLSDEADTIGNKIEKTILNNEMGLENLWYMKCE